ncbi:MAG: hypothetical protein Q9217_001728 [Psora testacea]
MSIDINWDTFTSGPRGQELADSIRDFIHDKFQQIELPRFIRSVAVHSFDFGEECPVVELKDISDPLPDFYDNDESHEEEEREHEGKVQRQPELDAFKQSIQPTEQAPAPSTSLKPNYIDTRLPNLRSNFGTTDQITTPFLSRSNTTTPGIPRGTSNLSYFHLPLSAGLTGSHTPLSGATPFTPPWPDYHHHNRPPTPLNTHQPQNVYGDPNSSSSTARSQYLPPEPLSSPGPPSPTFLSNPLDLQTTLHISYSGSLSLSLTAEILLDYPMPSFVGIPLKLNITGLSFDGVGLFAYIRGKDLGNEAVAVKEGSKGKIKFCFLGPEDARMMLGSEHGGDDSESAEKRAANTSNCRLGGLLQEIRVESEIGRQEDGKQVLKNVGKVERFVLEQVRRIFEDEFVFPSFWTFLV